MGEELVLKIKESNDVIHVGTEVIIEVLEHLTDFCNTREVWHRDHVKNTVYQIGEEIFDKGGLSGMRQVYQGVRFEMGPSAARYLEDFWNGIGYGVWRK